MTVCCLSLMALYEGLDKLVELAHGDDALCQGSGSVVHNVDHIFGRSPYRAYR